MERFAEDSGDLDAIVEVRKKDMRYAHDYDRVIKLYREAGELEKALLWVKQGFEAFPNSHPWQVKEEAIKVYVDSKQYDEALSLCWDNWKTSLGIHYYAQIKEISKKDGSWNKWKKKIYDLLHEKLSKHKQNSGSSLVGILLHENKGEEAWEIASEFGCEEDQWRALARLREDKYPLDAVPIYKKQVKKILNLRNPKEYPRAVEKMEHVGKLYMKAEKGSEFVEYFDEILVEYKRLRSFVKAVDLHPRLRKTVSDVCNNS